MFGYILPEKSELKVREYELFRAYYCGVCKSIALRYGQIPRLTLNYDTTFLAVLLSVISDEKLKTKVAPCIAHPISKRAFVFDNKIIDYAADMNLILAYNKLMDNWSDEKSVSSVVALQFLKSSYKKLKKVYPDKCKFIEDKLNELSVFEKQKCDNIDMVAEPFAKLMEEIIVLETLYVDNNTEKILRWIGYNLGKWLYTIDAFDDIQKDIDSKAYNPFLFQHNYDGSDVKEFKSRIKPSVEFSLTYTLSQISKGFELLNKKNDVAIAENIIYMGLLRKTEKILNDGSCNKVEKSI